MESFGLKASLLLLAILLFTEYMDVAAQHVGQVAILGVRNHLLEDATKRMTLIVVSKASFTLHTSAHQQCLAIPRQCSLLTALRRAEMAGLHLNVTESIHSDDTPVVALSTGMCDSTMGCDEDHDYQPPCPNNIVDASKAVWEALGVPLADWGELDITWTLWERPAGALPHPSLESYFRGSYLTLERPKNTHL
ncbi:putative ripening-related protein 1 [Vitis vinifera]|uniref:Putative ripening-related protein 1 n=1 Tax=Vitis vinifera TaxID=29760 RepID=A0A438D5D3_VITVI|nr:putative ripening-related protein 1 [Vitis vinifera]